MGEERWGWRDGLCYNFMRHDPRTLGEIMFFVNQEKASPYIDMTGWRGYIEPLSEKVTV
jgi:hypothetical protein